MVGVNNQMIMHLIQLLSKKRPPETEQKRTLMDFWLSSSKSRKWYGKCVYQKQQSISESNNTIIIFINKIILLNYTQSNKTILLGKTIQKIINLTHNQQYKTQQQKLIKKTIQLVCVSQFYHFNSCLNLPYYYSIRLLKVEPLFYFILRISISNTQFNFGLLMMHGIGQTLLLVLSYLMISYQQTSTTNYVLNAQFSDPTIHPNSEQANVVYNWTGQLSYLVRANKFDGKLQQYISIKSNKTFGGYIQQQIQLPYNGTYQLSYKQKPTATTAGTMRVYWNNILLANHMQNTVEIFNIEGIGKNILKFQMITNTAVQNLIDNVSVTLVNAIVNNITNTTTTNTTNTTNSTNQINITTTNTTNTTIQANTTTNTTNITNTTNQSNTTINTTRNTTSIINQTTNTTTNNNTNNTTSTNTATNQTNSTNNTAQNTAQNTSQNVGQNTTHNNANNSNVTSNSTYNSTLNSTQTNSTINSTVNNTGQSTNPIESVSTSVSKLKSAGVTAAGIVFSLPVNQAPSMRFLYIFIADIWLYNYDNITYQGILNDTFNTATDIQQVKFQAFETYIGWVKYANYLPVSNYTRYTRQKFLIIQATQSTIIKSNFTFFIYTVPQQLIVCLVLHFLFRLLSKYKISKYLRSFYFFKTVFLQSLLEGNLAYLTFVCFNHISFPFSFCFSDKVSLALTIVLLFVITVFTFCFYLLVGSDLKAKASYFIYAYYRCNPSFCLLTIKNLVRGFLQGAVHCFLYYHYGYEMFALSLVEIMTISFIIFIQKKKVVYLYSSMFCRDIIYHFMFIALNFTLFIDYLSYNERIIQKQIRNVVMQAQVITVYIYAGILVLTIVMDLLPLECFQRRQVIFQLDQEFLLYKKKQMKRRKKKALIMQKKKKKDDTSPLIGFNKQRCKIEDYAQDLGMEPIPKSIIFNRRKKQCKIKKNSRVSGLSDFSKMYSPRHQVNPSVHRKNNFK